MKRLIWDFSHVNVFILLLVLSSPWAQGQNVLLFTIDSCRADRFGCYGYHKKNTPTIDSWAKTGTLFTNAYSTTAWTAPGLASILTGLYPPTHGINNRDHMGPEQLLTLVKILKEKHYKVPSLNFFTFAPYYRNLGVTEIERSYFGLKEGDELVNWLKQHAEDSVSSPFFVWYHSVIIHQPYNPIQEDLGILKEKLPSTPGIKAVMNGAIVPQGSTQFSKEDKPTLDLLYDSDFKRVDRLFKQVLDVLAEKDLLAKTLIILTADHGEELLDHGFVGHASTSLEAKLYEEFIHIPLIFSWPGKVPEGKRVSHLVSQIDITPTILSLLDMEPPQYLQGQDLSGIIGTRELFFESVIAGNQTTKERENIWVRAIRSGRYKYISTGELYDLEIDPGERTNLYENKPAVTARLSRRLEEWLEESKKLGSEIFPSGSQIATSPQSGKCVTVYTPQHQQTLDYDFYTGMLLFDWTGDMQTTYLIEYDIGEGSHHVSGTYEIGGNHQLMGPLTRELWGNLKAWNPFRFRITAKTVQPCWSPWVEFKF